MNQSLPTLQWTPWQRFWHQPLRAERLAATRILLATAALTEQLVQYFPYVALFYGPEGIAPQGLHDEYLLSVWRWPILLFNTDDLTVVWTLFWVRFAVTVAFLVGWQTRLMNVLLYFLTMAFLCRNPTLENGSDDTLMVALFLMMFAQSGRVFSVDSWLRQRRNGTISPPKPEYTPAWPVRLLQIQLCMIYLSTGLAKLVQGDPFFETTWWDGTSIHYTMNYITMGRRSYAELPLPLWITGPATYLSVGWEVLFTPLVLFRRTRWLALWFGVLFHLGIWLTIEVGWFSFYTLALYGVWIPGEWWDQFRARPKKTANLQFSGE
jgi:hypothetical protein